MGCSICDLKGVVVIRLCEFQVYKHDVFFLFGYLNAEGLKLVSIVAK